MLRGFVFFILIFQLSFARADIFEQCLTSSESNLQELQKLSQFHQEDSLASCLGIQKRGNQSDLWAQEMIGTDLVHQRIKDKNIKLNTVRVGVIDTLWNIHQIKSDYSLGGALALNSDASVIPHGTNTVNTLSAKNSKGIASSAHPILFPLRMTPDLKNNPVDLINISATHDNPSSLHEVVGSRDDWQQLYNQRPVFMSSGNASRTLPSHTTDDAAKQVIFIAAVEPSGLSSHYSTLSRSVAVMAPAGTAEYGTDIKINSTDFYSGTSAAAPITTGTFSDFFGVAGNLKSDEIKLILDKTSQPSPMKFSDFDKDKFGAGILNHYKIFRVAERLASNKAWPKNRDLLTQQQLYDFDVEAKELETSAIELLKSDECKAKKEGFKKIREAFLLNPSDRSRFVLSYLYRQMGLADTANYFWNDTKDKLVGSYIIDSVEAHKINRHGSARAEYIRFLSSSSARVVKKVLPQDAETIRYPALMINREPRLTGNQTKNFLRVLNEHLDNEALVLKTLTPTPQDKKNYDNMLLTSGCFKICLQDENCLKNGMINLQSGLGTVCQGHLKEFALKSAYAIKPHEFKQMSISILKQLGQKD